MPAEAVASPPESLGSTAEPGATVAPAAVDAPPTPVLGGEGNPLRPGEDDLEVDAPISAKVWRYSQRFFRRHDRDNDGLLAVDQWPEGRPAPRAADLDGDGMLAVEEMAQYIANYGRKHTIRVAAPPHGESPFAPLLAPTTPSEEETAGKTPPDGATDTAAADQPAVGTDGTTLPELRRTRRFAARLPAGLPDWFDARDSDGDGQLTAGEFAPTGNSAQLEEFAKFDANHDGVVTAEECLRAIRKPAVKTDSP
jgi:Ca2+-binding EF-hand superfamily protein